jgi:HEXXH motif-containing protein
MRARLVDSLRYVVAEIRGLLELPDGFDDFLARLARGPVSAHAFGAYYELVLAVEAGDLAGAAVLVRDLANAPARAESLAITALGPEGDRESDRIRRLFDTDPLAVFELAAPPPAAAEASAARVREALALLDHGHPELAAEIRALVGEVVLASPPSRPGADTFDGASCFMLWGTTLLNACRHATRIAMAEALVHESAHSLLFGFAADGPLVENDDGERFPSPLRVDPRPLDGIYHAAFVSARMHHALARLCDAGVLDTQERAFAAASLLAHVRAFREGLDVIDAHARLTPLGAAVMKNARAYMESAQGQAAIRE